MVMLKDCGNAGNQIKAARGDTIDVCIEYSPLSCYMYDDTLGGFEYDLLRMVAAQGNVKFKFHPAVTLEKGLEGLKNKEYKILAAQYPMTAEAKNNYIFSYPIYMDKQVLVQLKDSNGNLKAKSQLDLCKDTIYVVKGSPMENRLRSLSREIGDTIFIKEEPEYSAEQLVIMVAKGLIRYAVVNERQAEEISASYPNVDIGTSISFSQFQSLTLPQGEEKLRDSINSWLSAVKTKPAYKTLYNRYFKISSTPKLSEK